MPISRDYHQAIIDFNDARRKAQLREVLSRLTGGTNELLSYEEVRQKLKAVEGSARTLEEIPLDSIVGSMGRYKDYTRDFLPRMDEDKGRWTSVMAKAIGLEGLPPIEVYKIGKTYFVKDGNHRVSVARQLGASHIQAYITEVRTRVPLSPDIKPDQLIIKAEQVNFLEHTQIDRLRPNADLAVTIPGQYPILEEHISVHRYFMGIDQGRPIPYDEAVTHWYDEVYLPVVEIIRERAVLKYFTQWTETDLYLWISRHRAELEEHLGWQVSTDKVADDLVSEHMQDFLRSVTRLGNRILDIVIPDPLESGPPVGHWRQEHTAPPEESLFQDLLVTLDEDPDHWYALDQALAIAKLDGSKLLGLHIFQKNQEIRDGSYESLRAAFAARCKAAGVEGKLAFETGGIARIICERAQWADMVIARLAHPPGDNLIERFESGFHTMIRRCSRPILAVPDNTTDLKRVLLAFNDSPKALEALYLAVYMSSKWGTHLTVLSVDQENMSAEELQEPARKYLMEKNLGAEYLQHPAGPTVEIILDSASIKNCNLILLGGYKAHPILEVVIGSLVDEVLRSTEVPVLICR